MLSNSLSLVFLLSTVTFALPGPSDISNTYQSPSLLENIKRQFTGGASIGWAGPPPDRCYHRPDKLAACPYGGQCRPDLNYSCETYCVNWGATLDGRLSCNLPCAYGSTGLKGEVPNNPMHCAFLNDRSQISCESGWACYRQFSEGAPSFEQRAPVCSPQYDLCDIDGEVETVEAPPAPIVISTSPAEATAAFNPPAAASPVAPASPALPPAPLAPVASAPVPAASAAAVASLVPATEDDLDTAQTLLDSAQTLLDTAQGARPNSYRHGETDTEDDDDRRKMMMSRRQATAGRSCKQNYRCVVDPRPSLGLPARKERQGICIPETAQRCTHGGVWNECGERASCGQTAAKFAKKRQEERGYCVTLLGDDWRSANGSVAVTMRKRGALRPMC